MSECPELASLEGAATSSVRAHVSACASCQIVVELLAERKRGVEARDRRDECARFEMLLAAREQGTIGGTAGALLEVHLRECADCQAVAATLPPPSERREHSSLPSVSTAAYALGREVARGGMGRILTAEDLRIGRPVAVKELLGKAPVLAARFEREARVTARLQHPGIVPIYEIGKWPDGTPFYAMRMVEGRTLRETIRDKQALDERLALLPAVIAAAEAVAFAHGKRIIHRDLTPNNILVGAHGDTVVIDWGLAKDLSSASPEDEVTAGPYRDEATSTGDLTSVGAVMGTAAYMPPEQARGEKVDQRADVYALGAILYHVLAGDAPYRASRGEDVVCQVKAGPPSPIRDVAPGAPRDVASIVEKAMAREPSDRYPSAAQLVEELRRFQTGRLVQAHDYSRGERFRRWVRAHRVAVFASAAALVAIAAAGSIGLVGVLRERDHALVERREAERQRQEARHTSIDLLEELGRQELLAAHPGRALALLSAAYSEGANSVELRFMLRSAMASFDGIERRLVGVPDRVIKVRFSPDGKRIVVVRQAVIEQWRIADGVRERNYRVLNFENGGVNFSRDGRRLVSFYRAGRDYERVHIWNTEDGTLVRDIDEHGVQSAWLPGPGNELVVIGHDGVMRVWDVARGVRLSSTQVGVPDGASSLTDDDKSVVAVSGRTQVSVWDWAHATRVATLEHGARLSQWPDWTEAPDAAHITTCGGGASTKLWDATTRKMRASFDATTAGEVVFCRYVGADTVIATTDDGYVYAASAVDGNVRISTKVAEGPNFTLPLADGVRMAVVSIGRYDRYSLRDLRTGTVYATLDGTEIDLSADKRLLALAQQDGSVELVRGTTGRMLRRFLIDEHPGEKVVAVTQDMTRAVTSGVDDVWSLWNLDSGERVPIPPLRSKSPMALSGDGTVMIGCLDDATVLLDTSTGQIISRLPVMVDANDFALDEHAHRLAVVSRTGPTKVWDLQAQRLVKTVPGTGANVAAMLDPGGRWLVTWEPFKSSRLQDLDSGGAPMHLLDSTFLVFGFSQDGTRLALGDDDNHTILVETAGGKHLFEGEGLGFLDRTGAHITTATTGLVQVHDVAAPTHPVGIPLTAAFRCAVALTPDATLVAGASGVWSAYDGRALATFAAATVRGNDRVPGQEHTGGYEIGWMVMSRDGRAAADVAPNSGVTVWDLSLEDRSPQEIARFVSAHVPWRVDGGRVVPVPSPTVRLRGRLTSHGKPIAAEVRVEYTNYAARSSANGDYAIENMLPGAVDVYGVTEDRSLYTGPHHVVLQPGDNTLDIDLAR